MTDGYGRDADADADAAELDGNTRGIGVGAAAHRLDADADDGPGGRLAGAHPAGVHREFDWRGWTLVGAIFVSFLVVPAIIALYPHVGPMLGLTFWDTYLALPMIPAVVLAVLAVWATTRP